MDIIYGLSCCGDGGIIIIKMDEPTLMVINGRYPFGQGAGHAQVRQVQSFGSVVQMRQRKMEMMKKASLVTNPTIIRLNTVAEQGAALVYSYEFVPHSIESYLQKKREGQTPEIWSMTKILFSKKLTYELTMLISYLGKMKIETELVVEQLGMSEDEKLKLFVNPRSKMGIKSEIQLMVCYNHSKDKIMKELQGIYEHLESGKTRFTKKREHSEPAEEMPNSRLSGMSDRKQKSFSKPKFDSIPKMDTSSSRLRQTRTFKESNEYRKRKMSSGLFDLGGPNELPKFSDKASEPSRSPKMHKYSFQHFAPQPQPEPENESYYKSNSNYNNNFECKQEQDPGIAHSKSIRIELEQKQNFDEKRQRKDSYKVKITTFREYEVQGNPANLFEEAAKEEDIFDYFHKRAKREEGEEGEEEEEQMAQKQQQYHEQQATMNDKYRKQTGETHFTNPTSPEPPSHASSYSPWLSKENINEKSGNRNRQLQQRIRQAKERTSKALNMIKALKK